MLQKTTYPDLKKSLDPWISLITESFFRLHLKGKKIVTRECLSESVVTNLLKNINLGKELTGKEKAGDLKNFLFKSLHEGKELLFLYEKMWQGRLYNMSTYITSQ